jgi:hypothetical protein
LLRAREEAEKMNRLTAVLALSLVGFAVEATSAPITFHFVGEVDTVQGEPGVVDELLGPGVTAGDLLGTLFHGSYTFESTAPDLNGSAALGQYQHFGSPYGMEFHFVHRSFSFSGITIGIQQDFQNPDLGPELDDVYAVQSVTNPHPTDPLLSFRGRLDLISHGTVLVGPDTALLGDDLPLTPPDINTFEMQRVFVNVLRIEQENGNTVSRVRAGLGIKLLSLTVPEPGLATLLLVGLGAMVLGRRRTR